MAVFNTGMKSDPKIVDAVKKAFAELGDSAAVEQVRAHVRHKQGVSAPNVDIQKEIIRLRIVAEVKKEGMPKSLGELVTRIMSRFGTTDIDIILPPIRELGFNPTRSELRETVTAVKNTPGIDLERYRLTGEETYHLNEWTKNHAKVAKNDHWHIDTAMAEAKQALKFAFSPSQLKRAFKIFGHRLAKRPTLPRTAKAEPSVSGPVAVRQPPDPAGVAILESRVGELEARVRFLCDRLAPLLEDAK